MNSNVADMIANLFGRYREQQDEMRTAFLFSSPRFWDGFGSSCFFWGAADPRRRCLYSDSTAQADRRALYSDWRMTQQDLRNAFLANARACDRSQAVAP